MFEDEMQESDLVKTAEDYYRVTDAELHDEKLARAQSYIRALEAQVAWMKQRQSADTVALMVYG